MCAAHHILGCVPREIAKAIKRIKSRHRRKVYPRQKMIMTNKWYNQEQCPGLGRKLGWESTCLASVWPRVCSPGEMKNTRSYGICLSSQPRGSRKRKTGVDQPPYPKRQILEPTERKKKNQHLVLLISDLRAHARAPAPKEAHTHTHNPILFLLPCWNTTFAPPWSLTVNLKLIDSGKIQANPSISEAHSFRITSHKVCCVQWVNMEPC